MTEPNDRTSAVLTGARLSLPNNTPEELRKAMRYIASEATDAEDCRELLLALGLIKPGFRWLTSARYGHGGRRKIELGEEKEAS